MRRLWSIGGLLIGAAAAVFLAVQSEETLVARNPAAPDDMRLEVGGASTPNTYP